MGFVCLLILAGCTTRLPMPTPATGLALPSHALHVIEQDHDKPQVHAMLVVRAEDNNTYWTLIDLLGIPLARQILQDGQWRNDGFLPPNPAARSLFIGLLFAWTPASELGLKYPNSDIRLEGNARTLYVNEQPALSVTANGQDLLLTFSNGSRWTVSPLRDEQ